MGSPAALLHGTGSEPAGGRCWEPRLGVLDIGMFSQCGAPTSQNQFDAMVDLAYNIGLGNFEDSTLLRLHKDKKYDEAANEFRRWNILVGESMLPDSRDDAHALFGKLGGPRENKGGRVSRKTEATHFQQFAS